MITKEYPALLYRVLIGLQVILGGYHGKTRWGSCQHFSVGQIFLLLRGSRESTALHSGCV